VRDIAIAAIDAIGMLRVPRCGVLGSTVVTARSVADPVETVLAALTVLESPKGRVTIHALGDSITSSAVNANHLRGTLAVAINVDDRWIECGVIGRLELAVRLPDGSEIVTVAELPVAPATGTTAYFKTDARASNGQPRTPNGTYSFVARAFDRNGELLVATPTGPFVIDNP
jgi:hypothetical protein